MTSSQRQALHILDGLGGGVGEAGKGRDRERERESSHPQISLSPNFRQANSSSSPHKPLGSAEQQKGAAGACLGPCPPNL